MSCLDEQTIDLKQPSELQKALGTHRWHLEHFDDFGEDGTIAEANYGGYARQQFANNKTNFTSAASDGNATITNNTEARFPTNTLGSNTITHCALFDALTGGNMYAWGQLSISKIYAVGDRPVFEVGSMTFTVD